MTLKRARRYARLIAALLLLASVRLPHLAADDIACLPPALEASGPHAETDHGLRPAEHASQEHCGVCHFNRSLRSPGTGLAEWGARVERPSLVPQGSLVVVLGSIPRNLPARAPPAALL